MLKQSPSVEKMFTKDEIGRLNSINKYFKNEFYQ